MDADDMAPATVPPLLERFLSPSEGRRILKESQTGLKGPEIELANKAKAYRKIFAVLILLGREDAIRCFLEAGIDDGHLPFRILQSDPDGSPQVHSETKPDKTFNHFFGLDRRETAMFMERQWSLLAPSLFDDDMVPRKAPPLALHPETILPFTSTELFNSGAYSKVYRVRIHESYHYEALSYTWGETQRPEYFAVKKLHNKDEAAFCREVAVLQELNEFAHPHIVPLLSSFKLGDEPHLVFPWADCDLSMFWRLNANPEPSAATSRWMLKQLTGLTDGLSLLHGFEKGKKDRRWHGRHGDIKPSNILVFSQPSDTTTDSMDKYALSLCDFGLSSFQKQGVTDATRRDGGVSYKHTPVYRAPEFDLEPCIVGESADLWSLGCVFLEAASWLVAGSNGLKCLAYCREDSGSSAPSHDAFFSMSAVTDGDWDTRATLKAQVCDAPSKRERDGRVKQPEMYAPDDKEKGAAFGQPQRMFTCPFDKAGIPMKPGCKGPGPGWISTHRVRGHLLRPHTPKSLRGPSSCHRCLEGFKTEELLAQHSRQEPQCLIKASEIIAGQLTLEQVLNLRSTRKKSAMTEEDRWFEIYQMVFPDHDLSTMNVTPYYEEMTVSSIDTLSTQSSTGVAEFKNYVEQEHKEKRQKKVAEFMDKGFDPVQSNLLADMFYEAQLKSLQEFEDNKLKQTYDIGVGGSDLKVDETPEGPVDSAEELNHYVDPYYVPEWTPEGTGDDELGLLLRFDS
ncbi:hypothetical protein CEP52_010065 [Fusarium oligoseptatum]|uniref:Protein kinase domain-containing protein n=1 Tax=Fusarium oligoseptatum TaxID=2604345 RepID=A0A428TA20_9HYPO|nr:hypothetical protein CEP52_010065 [Fusarium oligoseptatum]